MKTGKGEEELSLGKILNRLREEYWKSITTPEEKPAGERVELFSFYLSGERYGVDLRFGRHILKLPKIVKLPGVPDYILGVFNLRGEIIPALDLRRLFGMKLSSETENSRLLVVEAKSVVIGIYLDQIGDIIGVELKDLQALGGEETGVPGRYLKGYFLPSRDGKMLIYLDLEKLLGSEEIISFSA